MSTNDAGTEQPDEDAEKEFRIGLRAAILHLLHLAAGYEQRGLPAALDQPALKRDYTTLVNVVQKLLDHRQQGMKRRQKAVMQHLAQLVAPLYQHYASDPSMTKDDLAEECRKLLDARGVPYDPSWVKKLAIDRSELRKPDHKGPIETARYIVCDRVYGHSAAVLRDGQPPEQRAAHTQTNFYGQLVSKGVARRYVEQLFDWQPPDGHGEAELAALHAGDERNVREALGSQGERFAAAAKKGRGEAVDVADVPALRRFAGVDPAVKEHLLEVELRGLARFDPERLDDLAQDDRRGDLIADALKLWSGETAPPLTYTTGVEGEVEMYPSRRTRKASGRKRIDGDSATSTKPTGSARSVADRSSTFRK